MKDAYNRAIVIQKHWRGYVARKQLQKTSRAFALFQRKYRARKEREEEQRVKRLADEELRFQLLLKHRRQQRQRKINLMHVLEILPPGQISAYFDRQREYSARIIQSTFRGYRERKRFAQTRTYAIQAKAAICIQQAVSILYSSFLFLFV